MPGPIPIIDGHTHVHATRDAAHAFLELLNPELAETDRDGSLDAYLPLMDELGIQTAMILPWAFARRRYERELAAAGLPADADDDGIKDRLAAEWSVYNEWAAGARKRTGGRFASMCAIDPVLLGRERTLAQIERGLAQGAIGLKVVPGFMDAFPGDDRMAVVWEEADRRGLAVTAQCSGPAEGFAYPAHFEDVFRNYPNCRVVLAHIGLGGGEEEVVRLAGKYANVYGDTSSWLWNVGKPGQRTPAEAVDLLRRIGIDRILFGTNYPITDPREFVRVLHELPLTEDEKRKICFENARRVYPGIGDAG